MRKNAYKSNFFVRKICIYKLFFVILHRNSIRKLIKTDANVQRKFYICK